MANTLSVEHLLTRDVHDGVVGHEAAAWREVSHALYDSRVSREGVQGQGLLSTGRRLVRAKLGQWKQSKGA